MAREGGCEWLMGILLSNGVSMEISLAALVMASNRPEIRWLQADVLQSGQFVPGFLRFFRVTGIQSQLLLASEKSGTLSLRLVSAGQVLMAEDMAQLSRRIGLIQPFLLILVGVMVWFLMQVVMAPMSTMIQML
jgi:type II secretory pathway component PulF